MKKKDFSDKKKSVTTKTSKQPGFQRGSKRTQYRKGTSKGYDEAKEKYNNETSSPATQVDNDASWYEYSADIVNAAANINYLNPIGTPYHVNKNYQTGRGPTDFDAAPSLMVLKWSMTPGMSDDYVGSPNPSITAPINLQLRSLYTLMQSTVTQNLPFASSDLGIQFLFMDSIFSMYAHMQRFYYCYRLFKVLNRTVPEVFLKAYGMTSDAIAQSDYTIADLKSELLTLEQELNRIFIPKGLDIFNRHYWMNKHIFKDAPGPKAQMYMFVPSTTYRYIVPTTTTVSYGSYLERVAVPKFVNIKGMVDFFRSLLVPFYSDKDVWSVNGYVLRAFPSEQKWTPDPLDVNGILEPDFSPEVLTQIHNARIVGDLVTPETMPNNPKAWTIVQTISDTINWTPIIKISESGSGPYQTSIPVQLSDPDIFIDMPMDAPTAADNLVATRLTVQGAILPSYKPDPQSETTTLVFRPLVYGTELINSVTIYNGSETFGSSGIIDGLTRYDIAMYQSDDYVPMTWQYPWLLGMLSHFDMHPLLAITNSHKEGNDYVIDSSETGWIDWIGAVNNYTVIDAKDLRKLHDAAALGEWLIK
jgi:hypothetical protein